MPCYDPYSDPRGLQRMVDSYEQALPDLRVRLNNVTALLCSLCGELEAAGWDDPLFNSVSPELLVWWKDHKAFDASKGK